MVHRFKIIVLVLLSFGIFMPEVPVVGKFISIQTAEAQTQRKSLFDVIRDRRAKRKERRAQQQKERAATKKKSTRQNIRDKQRKNRKRKKIRKLFQRNTEPTVDENQPVRTRNSPSGPLSSSTEAAEVKAKKDDAAKILIVGDFIATGIARELEALYAANPNFVVVSKTSPASGVVRYDVVNWEEEIPELLERHKPAVFINLLGMNDRQALRLPEGRVQPLSEPWMKEYRARVSKIAGFSLRYNTPMLWVGLPPVRFSKMNADYLTFNELYRTRIEAIGGTFVDVWDGFTNEDGKFVSAGPDVNGQIVRLRGSKGINMTRAGSRKLAFYVDKELRKFGISPDATDVEVASIGNFSTQDNQASIPQYDPANSGTTVVISLGLASVANAETLVGSASFLKADTSAKSVSYSLVEKGIAYQPKSGRVDAGWGLSTPEKKSSWDMGDKQRKHAIGTRQHVLDNFVWFSED